MGTKPLALVGIACLVLMALSPYASAARIYTSASSDGYLDYWTYYDRYNGTWESHYDGYSTESTYHGLPIKAYISSSTCWAVVQMPIATLRGTQLFPGAVKLWFYSSGFRIPVYVDAMSFDPGGTVTNALAYSIWHDAAPRELVTTVPIGDPGWIGLDVTSQVQSQVNAGYDWAGFLFCTSQRSLYDGSAGSVGSSEDGQAAYLEVVPEPSSLIGLIGGLAGLGMFIRRRR